MKKILVTGGTGLVGSHLLYRLCQQQNSVRALKRQDSDISLIKRVFEHYNSGSLFNSIEWVDGDVTDIPVLEDVMADRSHVFHCAALVSFRKDEHGLLDKINTEGTANVVNTALSYGIKKLIHVSSIAALGRVSNENQVTDENTPWKYIKNKTSRYSLSKYNAEREIWRAIEEGLPAAMVNPGVILGPCDWNKNTGVMFKNVWNGLKYYTRGGTGFVDVRDVVETMLVLMDSDISGERFVLVGKNSNYKEFLAGIASEMKKTPPQHEAGKFMVSLGRQWEAIASALGGRAPRITRETARAAFNTYVFDSGKAEKMLGIKFTPIEHTIANTWEFMQREYVTAANS